MLDLQSAVDHVKHELFLNICEARVCKVLMTMLGYFGLSTRPQILPICAHLVITPRHMHSKRVLIVSLDAKQVP
jgi:hypothetical protein